MKDHLTMVSNFPSLSSSRQVLGKVFPRRFSSQYVFLLVTLIPLPLLAQSPSPLAAAGYSVLPVPQKVTLTGKNFPLISGWQLQLETGVKENDVAAESLKDGLATKFDLGLGDRHSGRSQSGTIRMAVRPSSVSIGEANDRDKSALAEQAYRLTLGPKTVTVAANAAPGLFYGVQTLLQLIRRQGDRLWLPEGEIVDWPDLQLRAIYWDDAHHLERL